MEASHYRFNVEFCPVCQSDSSQWDYDTTLALVPKRRILWETSVFVPQMHLKPIYFVMKLPGHNLKQEQFPVKDNVKSCNPSLKKKHEGFKMLSFTILFQIIKHINHICPNCCVPCCLKYSLPSSLSCFRWPSEKVWPWAPTSQFSAQVPVWPVLHSGHIQLAVHQRRPRSHRHCAASAHWPLSWGRGKGTFGMVVTINGICHFVCCKEICVIHRIEYV